MRILLFILSFFLLTVTFMFLVIRMVFSLLNPRNYFRSSRKTEQRDAYYSATQQQNQKKIFEKCEGEYIDYEEVK